MKQFIIVLVLLFASSTKTIAESENLPTQSQNPYLTEYEELCDYYILQLTAMKNNVDYVYKTIKEYDSVSNKMAELIKRKNYDSKKYDQLNYKSQELQNTLTTNYTDAFVGIHYSKYDLDKVKSANQLKSIINSSIYKFNGYKICFINSNISDNCIPSDLLYCKANGFDVRGLYQEKTSDFININKEYVDILDTEPYASKLNDLMCHFKGELSGFYEQQNLIVEAASRINWTGLGLYESSEFNKYCINNEFITEHNSNIDKLKERYPEFSTQTYYYNIDLIKNRCQTQLDIRCLNTYVVKNEVILSYPTVGCDVRDVTKADVENDAKYMSTNAEKLIHLTMTDRIDFCQMASNKGYTWSYSKPSIDRNCLSKTQKKKPKRK